MKLFVSGFVFNIYNCFNHCQCYACCSFDQWYRFPSQFLIQWYQQVLLCLLKMLYQFHKCGTDSMIHGKKVQLYSAKAFLGEVSEPQSSFWSPWAIKSFLQTLRSYVNSFCFLHWASWFHSEFWNPFRPPSVPSFMTAPLVAGKSAWPLVYCAFTGYLDFIGIHSFDREAFYVGLVWIVRWEDYTGVIPRKFKRLLGRGIKSMWPIFKTKCWSFSQRLI